MRAFRALLRRLRSRRLALGLITVVMVYSFVATLVPQLSRAGGPAVGAWQLAHPWFAVLTRSIGLHAAFSSPLFLAAVALLGASTAACSWERTRAAARDGRGSGRVSERELARLRERPRLVIPLDSAAAADPLGDAERALAPLGLRTSRGPRLLEASSGRLGLLGSPIFHWTLTALFVVIALGRLTRAEGLIGLPVGFMRTDAKESYRKTEAGSLYPGHSGLTLLVTDLRPFKDAGGVDRGVSPTVELRDGKAVLRRQPVYANNPLRYGSLMIHSSDYGLAAVVSVETSAGEEIASAQPLLDFDDTRPSGTSAGGFDITDAAGASALEVTLTVPLDRVKGKWQRARPVDPRVEVTVRGSAFETTTILAKGEALTLPEGYRLKLDDVVHYARLSVVDDWSIYPMYALFVLAAASLAVSLLVPYRRVVVMRVDGEMHALLRSGRVDALFPERVEAALREATGRSERDAKEERA